MKVIFIFLYLITFISGQSVDEFIQESRRQETIRDAQSKIANPDTFQSSTPVLKETNVPPPTSSQNMTFISKILVEGNTILTPFEIYYLIQPYKNRNLSTVDIFKLIQQLQNEYVKRGFTTSRVSINQKKTQKNTLSLLVVEGEIGRIYTQNNHWLEKIKLWQLFPIRNYSLANDYELRIGLNNARRLTSIQINTQLEPGFKLGETNILTTINRVKSPWSFYASFNGVSSSELIPSFIQITGDNLIGIFDQWKLSYSHTISDYQNSNSTTLTSSVPFRRHLFSGSITHSNNNIYTDTFSQLREVNDTENKKYSLSDEYTIHYDNISNIKFKTMVAVKRNRTKQGDVYIDDKDVRQTLGGLSLSGNLQWWANFNGTITFEKTLPWWSGRNDDEGAVVDSEHYEFEKWSGSVQMALSYPLPYIGKTASNFSSSFQTIDNITQSSEHAVLGGWYSVKGFNSTPIYGENYIVFNSEQMIPVSQYPLPKNIKDLNIQLKWFGDAGAIHRKHGMVFTGTNVSTAYAIGTGVGIGMSIFNGQFDFKVAKGLKTNITIPQIESFWSWSMQF